MIALVLDALWWYGVVASVVTVLILVRSWFVYRHRQAERTRRYWRA